jgi:hypothetical protein
LLLANSVGTPRRTVSPHPFGRAVKEATTTGALTKAPWAEIQITNDLDQPQIHDFFQRIDFIAALDLPQLKVVHENDFLWDPTQMIQIR